MLLLSLNLRDPYPSPTRLDGARQLPASLGHRVTFRHAGYSDDNNIILILPALDDGDRGIHHETARIAVAITANNRWDGYFTESRDGPLVTIGPHEMLRAREYYFRVSDDATEKHPIVPSFAHWRFPHGDLPPLWAQAQASIADVPPDEPLWENPTEVLMARDVTCRVTGVFEGTEHAHLVPRSERVWFEENGMFAYADPFRPDVDIINDPRNAILLRRDIHNIFDHKRFALVPQRCAEPVFASYVLAAGSSELVNLYHNIELRPLYGIRVEYLLARFAWTIFSYSRHFLKRGIPRVLQLVEQGVAQTRELPGDQCKIIVARAATPAVATHAYSEVDCYEGEE